MSITRYAPNTVWLSGSGEQVGDIPAGVAIVPGMLIERYLNTTAMFRPCTITTAIGVSKTFALNQSMLGKGCGLPSPGVAGDAYAVADLVEALIARAGATIWALVATSAPAIAIGDKLESAGDGTLRKYTSGTPIAIAMEALTNTSGANSRLKIEVL